MSKTAILLGATGLTGSLLLQKLIEDTTYTKIKLFSRSATKIKSDKIQEHIIDVLQLENYKEDFTADEVFCCIGTTAAKTKDSSKYKQIDYGIPVAAAKLAKENNMDTFVVMSSMGADAASSVFYSKTKGEMERDVLNQKIKNTYILRPSLIGGNRNEFRLGENIGKGFMSLMNPFMKGGLEKYKMIHPEKIASCMQKLANNHKNQSVFSSDEIEKIANSKK
ncbi:MULTISPECIES: NAD(P)H-binding protein [unclassified Polaribacter]|uniref:NAD(P)H-binding protein n=1 Tax=unclassified Polaribacter TaxID=196858 RepID=UPI0011BF07B7|nr:MULTISPECIES: NAD(P)H-binding protein [unclassified Polaribacter]TXD52504.1 NAD-dependent epimerase/dehydratase family protein [Polaribacter sp. IC063]TXD60490.1 NAD-dependent epimerase/dehydratase family protein [Polaribacter sp. IC066]